MGKERRGRLRHGFGGMDAPEIVISTLQDTKKHDVMVIGL